MNGGVNGGVGAGVSVGVGVGDELIDEEGSVVGVVLCATDAWKVASYISGAGAPTVVQYTQPGTGTSSSDSSSSGSSDRSSSSRSGSSSEPITTMTTIEDSTRVWAGRLGGGINGCGTSNCLVLLKASYVVPDSISPTTSTSTTTNNDSLSSSSSPVSLFIRSHHHPSAPLISVNSYVPAATDADAAVDDNFTSSVASFGTSPCPPRIAHPVTFATYDTAYSPAPPVEKVMPPGKLITPSRLILIS